MSQSKNIACMVALSISTALASTGCVAQDTGDETANGQETQAAGPNGEEKTGEASQAQCGFCPLEDFGFFPGAITSAQSGSTSGNQCWKKGVARIGQYWSSNRVRFGAYPEWIAIALLVRVPPTGYDIVPPTLRA